jgi:hypothetical protein
MLFTHSPVFFALPSVGRGFSSRHNLSRSQYPVKVRALVFEWDDVGEGIRENTRMPRQLLRPKARALSHPACGVRVSASSVF